MKKYGIDRFEGNLAVLVDGEGMTITVEREKLPPGTGEGDIVSYNGNEFYEDPETTQKKRNETIALIDELFK